MPGGSRVAALCAATLVTGALTFGSGVAFAADKPIRGTDACTQIVNANANVQTAEDKVDAANEELARRINGNDTTANINAARADLTRAQNQLAIVRANTTALLCRDADTTTPPVTTTPPRTTTPPADDPTPPLTDDRDCDDFSSQDAAQAYFLDRRTAAQPDPDRLDRNGNGIACEGTFGDDAVDVEPADEQPAPTTQPSVVGGAQVDQNVTVNPTQDDGSVVPDGSQVSVIPEGSVSTGAA